MKKEVESYMKKMPDRDLTITGILLPSKVLPEVSEFYFSDQKGQIVSGELLLPSSSIDSIVPTGRKIHLHGLVYDEIMLTFLKDASIPADAVISFVRRALRASLAKAEEAESLTRLLSIFDKDVRSAAASIGARCNYAGCGASDSWPKEL